MSLASAIAPETMRNTLDIICWNQPGKFTSVPSAFLQDFISLSDDLLTTKREVCTGGREVRCKRGACWLFSERILDSKSEPRALCGEQQQGQEWAVSRWYSTDCGFLLKVMTGG